MPAALCAAMHSSHQARALEKSPEASSSADSVCETSEERSFSPAAYTASRYAAGVSPTNFPLS